MTAHHDRHDGLLNTGFVNATNLDVGTSGGKRARTHLLRIAENREIGVVGCKDELDALLKSPYQLNDVLKDRLVVQVVFRLVYDDNVVIPLAQNKENQGGRPLAKRVLPQ